MVAKKLKFHQELMVVIKDILVSEASDGYEIFETDNLPTGTTIKLYLKDNTRRKL